MSTGFWTASIPSAALLCIALCCPSWATGADADDIAELKRAFEALQAQNRALTERVAKLEAEKSGPEHAGQQEQPREPQVAESRPEKVEDRELEQLDRRVKELEIAKTAQEDATRSIIRDSVSTLGSNINESVALGGNLEVAAGWAEDFSGEGGGVIGLVTAELDFEVRANDWTLGSFIFEYDDGSNASFRANEGFDTSIQRINLDTAYITVGNHQRFPLSTTAGRVILPFGISTGNPVADVLTVENPLTIDVFEMRQTAIRFDLAFPTPALAPLLPPVIAPRVSPQIFSPLVGSLSRTLGYQPLPTPPPKPNLLSATPAQPPYNLGVYFFDGHTNGWDPGDDFGATLGYRTKGHCGRPYHELASGEGGWTTGFCPWSLDLDLDYNSSVFDSQLLEAEYGAFINQIGRVPGMAASVKATLGPLSLVGEWNGALSSADFVDDLGTRISMTPSAWQLSLGYQLDWNPWVEAIGEQGTFFALSYSETQDLAGVTQLIDGQLTRVGNVPRRRVILTVGEWVADGLKFSLEYSRNWDYPEYSARTDTGILHTFSTGRTADSVLGTLTYVW